ncbi:hypothetical protein [Actinomadura madurae]|nr:hypothetical protein [Actinomadura madurae]
MRLLGRSAALATAGALLAAARADPAGAGARSATTRSSWRC